MGKEHEHDGMGKLQLKLVREAKQDLFNGLTCVLTWKVA